MTWSALVFVLALAAIAPAQTLKTRWAAGVTPENAWREYPRPQMVRKNWVNLNGLWTINIIGKGKSSDPKGPRQILVPFPIESQLSGVHEMIKADDTLVYTREFDRPKGDRILLHFGACDWSTKISVNGKPIGSHVGGYDAFSFDITGALNKTGKNVLKVEVTDPSDANWQPRGKQVLKPGGIFYTPTSGIWQTVWLESVPETFISNIKIDPKPKTGEVDVLVTTDQSSINYAQSWRCRVEVMEAGKVIAKSEVDMPHGEALPEAPGRDPYPTTVTVKVPDPKLWSPDSPNLYDLRVSIVANGGINIRYKAGTVLDRITSYFGFREISLIKNGSGQPEIALNGKPIFLVGPLDQGFWPDGLYTPPSDVAMKYDLEVTKRLGFNMIRKHVKVEPARWYYWCDKLGICVLQDMPSGDKFIAPDEQDIKRSPESGRDFEAELKALVETHYNHPSIVTWVLYNEGWGQWDTARLTDLLRALDSTRLIDSVTGWAARPGIGDYSDIHSYPGPDAPANEIKRAIFLGEFGGLGLPVPGHMWLEKGWGYQSFKTSEELTDRFVELLENLHMLRARGLSGAVYTQTTDVETELNGFMTYDRARIKMDEARVRQAVRGLFTPPPVTEPVLPTSEAHGMTWKYLQTSKMPSGKWVENQHDDSDWQQGPGGFGTPETPGAVIGTRWDTPDIFLRRQFTLDQDYSADELRLRLSYDDDVEVYLDGKLVYKAPGWTTSYKTLRLPVSLKKGEHLLAIHCHQNSGGQYIDAGIVRVR